MDVSPVQLLERAKERFALNDYFGAIHLLVELTERGRAYADAQHLLGLCYHLADQPERALERRNVRGRLARLIPDVQVNDVGPCVVRPHHLAGDALG